jgi:hypothetical protein
VKFHGLCNSTLSAVDLVHSGPEYEVKVFDITRRIGVWIMDVINTLVTNVIGILTFLE